MFLHKYAHLLILALGLSVLFFGFAGNHGYLVLGELKRELSGLESERDRLQNEAERIREKIHLIEVDNEYLEKVAREDLGLSREGEIVYHFSSE